ncbi:phospho-N-acetylmuramoyl-pentapeptide-transferase [Devriesea agamarum]|uniref:phospho-N-acetylmuramoyl-pentapeptide- transferase n=1 Tax=Devriesea agamarum TaxID=472569 RepID=UPI00071CAA94|nr:phospho-N-acetylmuramoyl-pentapeptide-transferase [Devriesea agamarum]
MIPIIVAGGIGFVLSFIGTPMFIRLLEKKGYGQFIRDDGPTSHHTKRGTPTMGGTIIILASIIGFFGAHALIWQAPTVSGMLVLFLMAGLGIVGFADDYIKISRHRSLGLRPRSKLAGQFLVATVFAVLALSFPNADGLTPASSRISFVRDIPWLDLAVGGTVVGIILFAIWSNFLVAAWSNGVNLTDGLDGLATGATILFTGAYVLIAFWQWRQSCDDLIAGACYSVRDPQDIAVVASAIAGACVGFLWWNTSPAKIFMGDTGALALGGALAGLTMVSRTELLGAIIGGLFVVISLSVIIQVGSFKMTGKRVFRMAPLQHHFELKGWGEVTIVVRFWIIAVICAAAGLGIFYLDAIPRLR